jgi:ADP-ribose pyrophosphatase YjhB (NUDIX family)
LNILYAILKRLVALGFNILNFCLKGNLPPFGCATVIVEEQDRYLVIERPDGEPVFPGGFVHWNEHPSQAALREGREETGFELQIGDALGYYSVVSSEIGHMSTLNITYVAHIISGTLRSSIEGPAHWLDEQTLRATMNEYYLSMLNDYLAYRSRACQKCAMMV